MIKIKQFTKNPLTTMGEMAGYCYDTTNPKAFKRIGMACMKEGHHRVTEFADVTMEISGYSAKVVRELYCHIIGTSRLQASTRYIDYSEQFRYITPPSINNKDKLEVWENCMYDIQQSILKLKELGVPTEDYTNLLPLAYSTKMVLKINVRALIHMFNMRSCTLAYHEFRELMKEMKRELENLDEEWKWISDNFFVPKCVRDGFCIESKRHCGLRPLREEK